MTKYIEKQAATIDEAVQLALDELQMDRDSVSVEVLEKGKSGFMHGDSFIETQKLIQRLVMVQTL